MILPLDVENIIVEYAAQIEHTENMIPILEHIRQGVFGLTLDPAILGFDLSLFRPHVPRKLIWLSCFFGDGGQNRRDNDIRQ